MGQSVPWASEGPLSPGQRGQAEAKGGSHVQPHLGSLQWLGSHSLCGKLSVFIILGLRTLRLGISKTKENSRWKPYLNSEEGLYLEEQCSDVWRFRSLAIWHLQRAVAVTTGKYRSKGLIFTIWVSLGLLGFTKTAKTLAGMM